LQEHHSVALKPTACKQRGVQHVSARYGIKLSHHAFDQPQSVTLHDLCSWHNSEERRWNCAKGIVVAA
jgi:hypothetical protein